VSEDLCNECSFLAYVCESAPFFSCSGGFVVVSCGCRGVSELVGGFLDVSCGCQGDSEFVLGRNYYIVYSGCFFLVGVPCLVGGTNLVCYIRT